MSCKEGNSHLYAQKAAVRHAAGAVAAADFRLFLADVFAAEHHPVYEGAHTGASPAADRAGRDDSI